MKTHVDYWHPSRIEAGQRTPEEMMHKNRPAFTLVEILIVIAIISIVLAMSLPKMGNMNDRNQMRSAKDGIASRIATARATAIGTGRTATFYMAGDSMRFTTGTGAAEANKGTTINLYKQFGVRVISSAISIPFDGRGMTSFAGTRVKFTRGSLTDSLCISPIGLINRHGCAQ